MHDVVTIVVWTLVAGVAMPVGAAMASIERIRPLWLEEEFRHFVTAFGGGVLLSAVGLVLVPEGAKHLSIFTVAVSFSLGGVCFLALDVYLVSARHPAAQAAAMLADFIPEALALGAVFISTPALAPLLAAMICLQNLPEGFNAYRELAASSNYRAGRIILLFSLLAFLGPVFGLVGYFWLSSHEALLAGVMIFSGGGILYLVFQDIAPQAKLEKHWAPPLGAVLGFLLGVVAQMLVAGEQSDKRAEIDRRPATVPMRQENLSGARAVRSGDGNVSDARLTSDSKRPLLRL